jgi:hypothetical protein
VIYLTPKGTEPPEQSICAAERDRRIEAGQLRLWSYDKEILEWLARCRAECRADRVSMFIDEFSPEADVHSYKVVVVHRERVPYFLDHISLL